MSNLLKVDADNARSLKHEALALIGPYAQHQLYHSPLDFLWDRQPEGNPALLGDGAFVASFLSEVEYFQLVTQGFNSIEEDNAVHAQYLRALYLNKWTPPNFEKKNEDIQAHVAVATAYNVVGVSQNVAMILIVTGIVLAMFLFRWCTRRSRKDYTLIPTSSDSVVHV